MSDDILEIRVHINGSYLKLRTEVKYIMFV